MTQTKAELLGPIRDNIEVAAQNDVRFQDNDSSHYVALQAPATVSSNVTFTLPAADGSANYLLKTDGSGNLGWAADSSTDSTKMPLAGGTFTGDVVFDNATHAGFDLTWDMSDKALEFDDNVKAKFGDGGDLEIWHDAAGGNYSYIFNNGAALLKIGSDQNIVLGKTSNENYLIAKPDNAVELYFDNVKRAETTGTGFTVTGTCTATTFSGSGASLTSLAANQLSSGTVPAARLGSGTASSSTYLRGNNTWGEVSGGVDSDANSNTVGGTSAGGSFTSGQADQNTCFGKEAGRYITTGDYHTAIGARALEACTTSEANTAVGQVALNACTTGGYNTAVGNNSLYALTTASYNVAMGYQAGTAITTGHSNVNIGYRAGYANTTNNTSVYIGYEAGKNTPNATSNVVIGYQAFLDNTASSFANTVVGNHAAKSLTTHYTTAIGNQAGYSVTAGGWSVYLGSNAGYNCTTGTMNVCIGANGGQGGSGATFAESVLIGGNSAMALTTGASNTTMGHQALDVCTTGSYNVAIGKDSCGAITTGNYNIGIGFESIKTATTGGGNIAVGHKAMNGGAITGANNTAVGLECLKSISGNINGLTAVGYRAGYSTSTHDNALTAFGFEAGYSNTSAIRTTAIGYRALKLLTTGGQNTALGFMAGYNITTGATNTCLGHECCQALVDGDSNTAVGYNSMYVSNSATQNVAVGREAMYSTTSGRYNVAVGYQALYNNTTGNENTALGYNAGKTQGNTTHSLWVANGDAGAGNANCKIFGNSSGSCYQGSNSSSWSTTSDRRLKKNIVDNTKGLTEINKVRIASFEYRTRSEIDMSEFPNATDPNQVVLGEQKEGENSNVGTHTGVIAQEIEAILPECIATSHQGAKTVNTDPLLWALINAVKELSTEITTLKTKVATLEAA